MSLGSDILAALNALSEADKRDITKIWDAVGGEIEDYPGSSSNIIKDNRDVGDVTPDDLPAQSIYYTFTNDIAGSPNVWDAVLNVKGWQDGYAAWQLFANSGADDTDKNLYFRRGRNAVWDPLQKVWTDKNDGIDSGLNADLLDGSHAAAFSLTGHSHDSTYLKLVGGTLTGGLSISAIGLTLLGGQTIGKFTVSTAAPSGGADNDLWFTREA